MTAEKYLQSIRDDKAKIEYLERAREDIANDIGYINSSAPNADRVQTSTKGDALERTALKHIERLKKLDQKLHTTICRYNARRVNMVVLIHRLPDDQRRRFLLDYYYECKSEEQITEEYRFENTRSIYMLRKRAIDLFVKNFENDVKKFDKDIIQKMKKSEKNQKTKPQQTYTETDGKGN